MLDPVPQVEVDPHWPWLASLNELGPSVDCYPLSQEKQGEVCGSFQHPRGTLIQPPLGRACISGDTCWLEQARGCPHGGSHLWSASAMITEPMYFHGSGLFNLQKNFSARLWCRVIHLK